MSLTAKQTRFVQEYLIDLNATQAAARAGYSKRSAEVQGCRLLKNDKVSAAIAAAQEARSERTGITQDWVLETIFETAERCKQASPVLDKKGDPVMVETPAGDLAAAYTFQAAAVLKAAELAGRHLKMFTDKIEATGRDGGPIEYADSDKVRTEVAEQFAPVESPADGRVVH